MGRPILFNSEMVKAILEGRKSQTRRIVKPQPKVFYGLVKKLNNLYLQCARIFRDNRPGIKSPYGIIGDRLWVRETFAIECNDGYQDVYVTPEKPLGPVRWFEEQDLENPKYFECPRYKASEPDTVLGEEEDDMKWKPSIHMPRWASRITLEITDIRVERAQEIGESDARAEGLRYDERNHLDPIGYSAKDRFKTLWDSINKKRGYSWESNPWVWVVEFKKLIGNNNA